VKLNSRKMMDMIDASGLPPRLRSCLRLIAKYASYDTGGNITVGVTRLAADSGLRKRTINRHLRTLEAEGVITSTARFRGGKQLPSARRINLNRLEELRRPPTPIPDPSVTPDTSVIPDKNDMSSLTPVSPNQSVDQSVKTSATVAPGFARFWTAWPKHHRKEKKAECLRHWRKSNLEADADTILACLESWKVSEQWNTNDGQYISAPLVWLRKQNWIDAAPPPRARSLPAGHGEATATNDAAVRARIAFYQLHPEVKQAHIAALKAKKPRWSAASEASILNAMPPALLEMPVNDHGGTNA
jgi:hypothetical protein